jgi:S-adenosylmethionine hydrolase
VGTARNIIAVESEGRVFLAPDNGLLTFIDGAAFAVTNESFFLPGGSNTFHGRDRFAPVAAAIANGVALSELGPRLDSYARLRYEPPSYGDVVRGTIVAVDRFGNAITDVERARMPFAPFALRVREHTIDRIEETYANAAPGAFLIVGSTGCIEISVANASAAERLQLRRLERVELRPL